MTATVILPGVSSPPTPPFGALLEPPVEPLGLMGNPSVSVAAPAAARAAMMGSLARSRTAGDAGGWVRGPSG
ncbi:hypothetical protein GCM10018785_67550 [Streptomyces longispororuber]|uniref:Uncharacterized protein n=1 Tax=Streptomyces longispororuber TaxID=68230 RepID=A0A919A7J4_9ACTN|nr:hypothetical protein GCM10018785_67550 [Streptomyces longispororuber]